MRVEKIFIIGFTVVYDEIFYYIFRTNALRATAVVVEPNLMKKASVVFAMAQDKTGTPVVYESKLRIIYCIKGESIPITVERVDLHKNTG